MSMWTAIALLAIAGIVDEIFNDKGKRQNNDAMAKELKAIHTRIPKL